MGGSNKHLKNRSPTKTLDKMTPYEAWHNKKPDLSDLHIFGCDAYHHLEEARRKLDGKTMKCRFLGYEGVNQFRSWTADKVIVSSHIAWNEVLVTEIGGYEDLVNLTFDDPSSTESTHNYQKPLERPTETPKGTIEEAEPNVSGANSDVKADSDGSETSPIDEGPTTRPRRSRRGGRYSRLDPVSNRGCKPDG